jgi:hypothetical protein
MLVFAMCDSGEKSRYVAMLFGIGFSIFGISWVMAITVVGILISW